MARVRGSIGPSAYAKRVAAQLRVDERRQKRIKELAAPDVLTALTDLTNAMNVLEQMSGVDLPQDLLEYRVKARLAIAKANIKPQKEAEVCMACAERAKGWDNPRWLTADGFQHRVPKHHRTTLCGQKVEPK